MPCAKLASRKSSAPPASRKRSPQRFLRTRCIRRLTLRRLKKRLAVAAALVQAPDLLLLDEPTNHLDLAGIEWLESILEDAPFACVVVSHDRYFLENVATVMVELSRSYEDGFLRVEGNYSKFSKPKKIIFTRSRNTRKP